jgi:hypothetical protein
MGKYSYSLGGTLGIRSSIWEANSTREGDKWNLVYNEWSQIWIFEFMMSTETWK